MRYRRRDLLSICLLVFLLSCFFVKAVDAASTVDELEKILQEPQTRITIPGLTFSEPKVEEIDGYRYINAPYLAEYMSAVYRYGVVVVSILSVIMIIVAGILWVVSGGTPDRIGKAKKLIGNAIIGLLFSVGSYTVLYTVNPELVQFRNLKIRYVKEIPLSYFEGGDTADGNSLLGIAEPDGTFSPPTDTHCPKSGGTVEIPKIVASLDKKVVYRYGGKHWNKPPYSESPGGNYYAYNGFCPAGYYCLDCSGFISFVHHCAGIKKPTGSANLLDGTELWNDKDNPIDFENGIVNGIQLQPGDILGWKGADPMPGDIGHVLLYVGTINGQAHSIAESSGAGRVPGGKTQNPRIRPLKQYSAYFPKMQKGGDGPRYYRLKRATD